MSSAPIARSALHEVYVARGARMEQRGPWHVPAHYGSIEAELEAARKSVAIGELCGNTVLEIEGTELRDLAARLRVEHVAVGTAAPVALPGSRDAKWCGLTPSRARVLMNPDEVRSGDGPMVSGELLAAFSPTHANIACLHATDISSGLTTMLVLGPLSPDLLARLVRVDVDPRAFADRSVVLTGAIGVPLQLLRWDRGSLLSYELIVGCDVAEYFWYALTDAGENLGLKPIGADALTRLTTDD